MRRGFSFYLVPALAVAAAAMGIVWGWIGVNAAIHGGGWVAAVLIVFGFGGMALALTLWSAWRRLLRGAQRGPGGDGRHQ